MSIQEQFDHKFVRIKSLQQLIDEKVVLIVDNHHCDYDGMEMPRWYGDGNLYYATYMGPVTFASADGGRKRAGALRLHPVIYDKDNNIVGYQRYSEIGGWNWLTTNVIVDEEAHFFFPYHIGDVIYMDLTNRYEMAEDPDEMSISYLHRYQFKTATIANIDPGCEHVRVLFEWGEDGYIPIIDIGGFAKDRPSVCPKFKMNVKCRRCGKRTQIEFDPTDDNDPNLVTNRNDFLCLDCRKRRFITPYHQFTPPLKFWKTDFPEDSDNNLYFGFELEIDCGGETDEIAATIVDTMNPDSENPNHPWFMHVSHDGSLERGMELISMPATLAYHKAKREEYKELFEWLKDEGYRSHDTKTCGLHFHFSRAFFGDNESAGVTKLLYLTEHFWDELSIFSRRDYQSLARYAKKNDCSPTDMFRAWNKTQEHDGHYYAVNITNENTVELRMFRGTLNINTFMATLDLVNAMVHAAKEKTPLELQKMLFTDLLTTDDAKAYYASREAASKFED